MCIYACVCTPIGQKHQISLEQESQAAVSCLIWVLGTELGSFWTSMVLTAEPSLQPKH